MSLALAQCRICLKEEENCSSLYEKVLQCHYLPNVIEYVCGVRISALDEPESCACSVCALALVQAQSIIKLFRTSDELLQRRRQQLKIQQQIIEDDEEQLRQEEEQLRLEEEVKLEEAALREVENEEENDAETGDEDEFEEEIDNIIEWSPGNDSTCENDDHDVYDAGAEAELPNSDFSPSSQKQKRKRRTGIRMHLKVNRQREFHFRCDLCEFETKFAKYYRNHLVEAHQVEKPRIFKCGHCPEAYMEHRTLREHVARVHEGLPRRESFLCSDCGKGFGKHSHLVRHSYVHRPEERPFQCNYCPMLFVNLSSLNRHIVTSHAEGKPFVCEQCDKAFGCIYNLRAHKKRVHSSDTRYECEICAACFRLRKSLKSHQLHGCR